MLLHLPVAGWVCGCHQVCSCGAPLDMQLGSLVTGGQDLDLLHYLSLQTSP